MKIKRYMNMSETRPAWAKVADALIEINLNKKWKIERDGTYQNIILQSLTVDTRESENGLPRSLKRMIRTARKHNVSLPPKKLEPATRMSMPIWHHTGLVGMKRLGYNSATGKCLRRSHDVKTVGDLLELVRATNCAINEAHRKRKNCKCVSCKEMRDKGCKNPSKCSKRARKLLNSLSSEWNPLSLEDLNSGQVNEGLRRMTRGKESTLFDKTIYPSTHLTDCIRVFVEKKNDAPNNDHPGVDTQRQAGSPEPGEGPPGLTKVYTDGSCLNNGYENASAGAGVWYSENDPRNTAARVPAHMSQTNNAGEALAILIAANQANSSDHLEILSDSKITIDGLTKRLKDWEDRGWIGVENKEILQATAAKLRNRKGKTLLTKVKGHSGLKGNEEADEQAKKGAQMQHDDKTKEVLTKEKKDYITGARLNIASQALLYRGILEGTPPPQRRGTTINLDRIRWAIKDLNGTFPTDKSIWGALRDRTITKESRAFLWKATHNAYKVGEYWSKIPDFEPRG